MKFRTITADNGTEFHSYKDVERATEVRFYFATPHHSWERGTNENTNGLIRQYLPKGTSMHSGHPARLQRDRAETERSTSKAIQLPDAGGALPCSLESVALQM